MSFVVRSKSLCQLSGRDPLLLRTILEGATFYKESFVSDRVPRRVPFDVGSSSYSAPPLSPIFPPIISPDIRGFSIFVRPPDYRPTSVPWSLSPLNSFISSFLGDLLGPGYTVSKCHELSVLSLSLSLSLCVCVCVCFPV